MNARDPGRPPDPIPSLDGRRFRPAESVDGGDVGTETTFEFEQDDDLINARYEGGTVRCGHLVGIHEGDHVRFRYAQVTVDGETATGRSVDEIEELDDGRIRLHETWAWDSREGEGTSVLEEIEEA